MNKFSFSDYDYYDEVEEKPVIAVKPSISNEGFKFSDYDFESQVEEQPQDEGIVKSAVRTGLQVPQARLEMTPPGILANLWALFAHGESELDPYEEASLIQAGQQRGQEFNLEEYEQNRQTALGTLPTVSNIGRGIEGYTGIPLEPKTTLQKGVRFGSQVAYGIPASSPGSPTSYTFRGLEKSLPRPVLGAGTATVREGLIQLGLPEPLADIASLAILKGTTGPNAKLPTDNFLNRFKKIDSKHQAEMIEKGVIPENLPKSQYDTAEEFLGFIKEQKKQIQPETPPTEQYRLERPFPVVRDKQATPLTRDRITRGERLGITATVPGGKINPEYAFRQRVGEIFSPFRPHNTTVAGRVLRDEIINLDTQAYNRIRDLYNNSRELNREISSVQPEIFNRVENIIEEISSIPDPSPIQRRLRTSANRLRNRLAEFNEEGEFSNFVPIENQTLIDQVQSLRQILDYDFAHGKSENIFRPLINEIQSAAITTAENYNPEAANALRNAQEAYRQWSETFNSPYIKPFRDRSNRDFSKLFKSTLDLDEANVLTEILSQSPEGTELAGVIRRELVEKNLDKFLKEPRKINQVEFDKALRELESIATPEQINTVRQRFNEEVRKPQIQAKVIKKEKPKVEKKQPTNNEIILAKYEKKTPEYVQKQMDSRSGIRELRELSKKDKKMGEVFERLSKQKMRSILREGNIEKTATGEDLYKFLNNEKNYELFSELIGENETEVLRSSSKELGKMELKQAKRKKFIEKTAKSVAIYSTIDMLIGLL